MMFADIYQDGEFFTKNENGKKQKDWSDD